MDRFQVIDIAAANIFSGIRIHKLTARCKRLNLGDRISHALDELFQHVLGFRCAVHFLGTRNNLIKKGFVLRDIAADVAQHFVMQGIDA